MTWTDPHTYAVTEIFAASTANLDIRDNLNFLKNTMASSNTTARALDTAYQNGSNLRYVITSLRLTSASTDTELAAYVGSSSTPSTSGSLVGELYNTNTTGVPVTTVWQNLPFWVPPDYWYKVVTVAAGGTVASVSWSEHEIYGS